MHGHAWGCQRPDRWTLTPGRRPDRNLTATSCAIKIQSQRQQSVPLTMLAAASVPPSSLGVAGDSTSLEEIVRSDSEREE
ncbi:hypothetical protein Taro_023163 [Colocasia esculenta]|uniref:Uncharacterized protein n=1 Tax=Colocasia esculenta TaxID=4460 RepID=A0A843V3H6_COLES|nr:hypothetical protein [Colocasia esculenta]